MEDIQVYRESACAGSILAAAKKKKILSPLYKRYGAEFTKYRQAWDGTALYKLRTSFPLFLLFELSDRCNYKCIMCSRGKPGLYRKYAYRGSLDFGTYKRLIDEARDNNCPSIALNNSNEPLLQKDLEKFIFYASQKGIMDIMINTNASVLTKERARSLIDSGLTRIMFSIDAATKDTYRKMRGKNNFIEVKKNILHFIDLKRKLKRDLPLVRLTFVRTSINMKEEEDFIEFWKDKCDYISFQEFLLPYYRGYKFLKPVDNIIKEPFRCISPWQRLIIQGDGSVLPCCQHYARDIKVGSVYEQTIKEIWGSEKMNTLREETRINIFPEGSVCYNCKTLYEKFIPGDIG